jgi:CO dehydrogenase maturation factor
MAFTLAVAGKGGTGKTSLLALLIQELIGRKSGPVLAVDADPNPNLAFALGYEAPRSISELRNELLDHIRKLPAGVTKDDYLETGIQECLWEGHGVDLLVMGAGEGPRCYCAVNSVLRRCVDRLRGAYPFVAVDNEAGLEHLSRCTTQDVDVLFIVADGSPVSVQAAARIHDLTCRLALRVGRQFIVLNNTGQDDRDALDRAGRTPVEVLGTIPHDEEMRRLSRKGEPLTRLPEDSPARRAAGKILEAALRDGAARIHRS